MPKTVWKAVERVTISLHRKHMCFRLVHAFDWLMTTDYLELSRLSLCVCVCVWVCECV